MKQGMILLGIAGVLFFIFAYNLMNDIESSDPATYVSKDERKQKAWSKYYTSDALGYPVLNLKKAPMSLAREIWSESRLREEMLTHFPDFEQIRNFAIERLRPSPFRNELLKKIEEIKRDYLSGEIDSETARERLENF